MRTPTGGWRRLVTTAAITAAGAFGAPTFLVHATAASVDPASPVISNVTMGVPVVTNDLATLDPALQATVAAADKGNPIKAMDDDGDIDAGCGLGNDMDRDHDCKTGEDSSSSSSSKKCSDQDNDGDQDCGGNGHRCDDNDADDHACSSSSSSSSSSSHSSGGGEDVCETSGLAGPTIGDQLVDAGLPLNEPEADGPISGALVSPSDPLEGTPLAPVVNEVGCAVNLLTL